MKNYYLITKEATKYWKKAIKSDRVMVANYDGNIYIVNGFNAFRFPAMPLLWDEIARPAFMAEMPADGAAVNYLRGEACPDNAASVANIFNRNMEDRTHAARMPFMSDANGETCRLFKNTAGKLAIVNVKYDALVDFSQAESIYCAGSINPIVAENEHFAAILLPMRLSPLFADLARETFGGLLEV